MIAPIPGQTAQNETPDLDSQSYQAAHPAQTQQNHQQQAQSQQQNLNNIFQWSMQYSDPKVLEEMKKQQQDPNSVQNPKALPAPMNEHQVNIFYEALNEALRLQTNDPNMNVDPIKMAKEKVEQFKKVATQLFIQDSSKISNEEKQKLEDELIDLANSLKDISEYYLDMNLHLTQMGFFSFIQANFFDFSKIKPFFNEKQLYFYEILGVFLEMIGSCVQNAEKVQKMFSEDLKFFPTILKFFKDLENDQKIEKVSSLMKNEKNNDEKMEFELILFKKRFLSCVNGFYTNIQQPVLSENDIDDLLSFMVQEMILQIKEHFSAFWKTKNEKIFESFSGFSKIQQQVLFSLQKTIFFLESTQNYWSSSASLILFNFIEKENAKISEKIEIKNFIPFFLLFVANFCLELFSNLKGVHNSIPNSVSSSVLNLLITIRKKIIKKLKKLQKKEKEVFDKIVSSIPNSKNEKEINFEEIWFNLLKQLENEKKSLIFPKFIFEIEEIQTFFDNFCDIQRFKKVILAVFKMFSKGGEYELKTNPKTIKKPTSSEEIEDFGDDKFGALRKSISPSNFKFLEGI